MISWLVRRSGFRAAFLHLGTAVLVAAGLGTTARAAGTVPALVRAAADQHLGEDPRWHALLHLENGHPRIDDPGFLLSAPAFTPERELAATLQALYGDTGDFACRFPARHAWLHERLQTPALDLSRCSELQEFLIRAPAQTISLAFASENIAQPASMMGHVFLVLEGNTGAGTRLAHAVSFYTDADTFNLPKLFFESLVTGKEGLFSLTPYADAQRLYVGQERRALWTYPLTLTDSQRELLLLHLHELRPTRFRYFFQGYNCATLVKHVLGVARPEILGRFDWWTTPADVVRDADAAGLIDEVAVEAPPRWRIGLLRDTVRRDERAQVQAAVRKGAPLGPGLDATAGFLMLALQRAYTEEMLAQRRAEPQDTRARLAAIDAVSRARYPQNLLQVSAARDPRRAPPDTQVSFGWRMQGGQRFAQFDLLPISHHLEDVRPPGNAETALSLLEVSLLQPLDTASGPRLHRLTLYGIDSVVPHDVLAGGISGKFLMGVDDDDPSTSTRRLHGWLGGSIGYTWRPHTDVDLYGLAGGGLYFRAGAQARTSEEVGLVVREAFGMKSVMSYTQHQHPREPVRYSGVWRWTQSKQLGSGWSVVFEARRTQRADARSDDKGVLLRRSF